MRPEDSHKISQEIDHKIGQKKDQKACIDALRSKHRKLRRELHNVVLQDHAKRLNSLVGDLPEYQAANHIAAYIAILGEISVEPIIQNGCREGKTFYLPILRGDAMGFAPWHPEIPLLKKKFGLLEPDCPESDWIEAADLDLVLTPLVVFDAACNRIGQGGGYYDRTFEFTRTTDKPLLIGVAHESQREDSLAPQPWDITLDKIITERSVYHSSV